MQDIAVARDLRDGSVGVLPAVEQVVPCSLEKAKDVRLLRLPSPCTIGSQPRRLSRTTWRRGESCLSLTTAWVKPGSATCVNRPYTSLSKRSQSGTAPLFRPVLRKPARFSAHSNTENFQKKSRTRSRSSAWGGSLKVIVGLHGFSVGITAKLTCRYGAQRNSGQVQCLVSGYFERSVPTSTSVALHSSSAFLRISAITEYPFGRTPSA